MKILFFNLILFFGLMTSACQQQKNTTEPFEIIEGDFLFQSMSCGPLCEAIEKVTEGYNGLDFNHMGLVVKDKDSLKVLEAVGNSVRLTVLNDFLNRSKDSLESPKIVVGRLKSSYQDLIPMAILSGKALLGQPYDDYYLMDNESLYCSELMYIIFREAAGEEVFHLKPMTFKDPETNELFSAWKTYYDDLGVEVPEGKPGINPGGISNSDKIQIVHSYSSSLSIK